MSVEQYDNIIDIHCFGLNIVFEWWNKENLFCVPYLWKLFPPFKGYMSKYYGMTWAFTLTWIGMELSIVREA